jgi:hypothetical protein
VAVCVSMWWVHVRRLQWVQGTSMLKQDSQEQGNAVTRLEQHTACICLQAIPISLGQPKPRMSTWHCWCAPPAACCSLLD